MESPEFEKTFEPFTNDRRFRLIIGGLVLMKPQKGVSEFRFLKHERHEPRLVVFSARRDGSDLKVEVSDRDFTKPITITPTNAVHADELTQGVGAGDFVSFKALHPRGISYEGEMTILATVHNCDHFYAASLTNKEWRLQSADGSSRVPPKRYANYVGAYFSKDVNGLNVEDSNGTIIKQLTDTSRWYQIVLTNHCVTGETTDDFALYYKVIKAEDGLQYGAQSVKTQLAPKSKVSPMTGACLPGCETCW